MRICHQVSIRDVLILEAVCFYELNYIATNTLDICRGATSTFVSYDGQSESLIDLFIIPVEKVDTINNCHSWWPYTECLAS